MVSDGEVRELQDRLRFYMDATADLLHELDYHRLEFREMTAEQVLAKIRGERAAVDLDDDD